MFSYYGSKSKIVDYYPAPMQWKIIEPFAGSARYALKYFDRDVLLVDKYEVIVNIWKYLQKCSEKDVLSFPNYKAGDRIIKEDLDCIEQYELLRLLLQQGTVGSEMSEKEFRIHQLKVAGAFCAAEIDRINKVK